MADFKSQISGNSRTSHATTPEVEMDFSRYNGNSTNLSSCPKQSQKLDKHTDNWQENATTNYRKQDQTKN